MFIYVLYLKLTGLWFIIIISFHSILVLNFKNQIVSVTNHNYYFMMNFCNFILWYFDIEGVCLVLVKLFRINTKYTISFFNNGENALLGLEFAY